MDQLVSRLLLYGDLGEEAILSQSPALFRLGREVVCPGRPWCGAFTTRSRGCWTWRQSMALTRICGRTT